MIPKRCDHVLRLAKRIWLTLMILLLYTTIMIIAVGVLSLMFDNQNPSSHRTQLLDYGGVQPKHSEGKVKPSADIINFKIPRDWKKDQSHGNENIPRVYTFSGGSWLKSDICKSYKSYLDDPNYFLTTSNSEAGAVKMFVHDPKYDAISGTIKQRHSFESENADFVISMLRKDPQLSLIDIGTNVGLYAMAAALLGRQVLAIDAVKQNIQHVCASVEYQNFTNRVALIYNAVSDSNRTINFRHGGNGDFGLSHVDADDIASQMNSKFKNYFANGKTMALDAVTLDDIVQLPRLTFFRNILIKMDVEGHEHRVLLGAKKFMKKKLKYIKGIIMEWQWFSGRQAENTILNLMAGWNFAPYRFHYKVDLLDKKDLKNWPSDVLWLPLITTKRNNATKSKTN